jgi:hypothetical protein
MATATLNGAIESGVNAGKEAVKIAMNKAKKPPVASGDTKKAMSSTAKKETIAAETATA